MEIRKIKSDNKNIFSKEISYSSSANKHNLPNFSLWFRHCLPFLKLSRVCVSAPDSDRTILRLVAFALEHLSGIFSDRRPPPAPPVLSTTTTSAGLSRHAAPPPTFIEDDKIIVPQNSLIEVNQSGLLMGTL
ncbi:PREDICTED: protein TRIGALACTOSYLDIACYLGLYCEROL 2, chloroplastic-like [Erythranthe guttata]|uniref:protein TRIGALACTOSYLDIACYLGLYCEROL 2, chloroplastic-like n=1 Tax=Erythranthe guttata TaxID=4155 RepID=UPI00064E07FD|nr:PREDICTED: protein TRIGALACTOSYLDIACYLGLYCEROL 2, chloroplastic-like [Erythranthe guttata]|eukprot:XP_012846724.1 PREDICTED: protein TRIGALACTOSYLDIACYLGLYCEROL 2, chloroplastic-like [Erythranthe guttata]